MRNYIKVDLYGQFDNDTRHECTYPVKLANQYSFTDETVWAKSISDPRGLHGQVCKTGSNCYVMWSSQYGNYFSYITRNPKDSRGGMAMVTLFIERCYVCDGRDILSVLKKLTARLINNEDYSYSGIKEDIASVRSKESSHCIPIRQVKAAQTTEQKIGYRTYETNEALIDIFTFIEQDDYSNFDKIIVVKKEDIKDNIIVPQIVGRLQKYYSIINQENVISNKSFIREDESFKIVFSQEGYDNQNLECHPPFSNNKFYSIDGNVITLNGLSSLQLDFTKTWFFQITRSTDDSILSEDTIDITVDGRIPDKTNRKFIRFKESKILSQSVVLVTATANHYKDYNQEFDLKSYTNNHSAIHIIMEPIITKIRVQFTFADKLETAPVFMDIDESSKYYQDLVNNNSFCGYHAYKRDNNIYYVKIPKNPKPLKGYDYDKRLPRWTIVLLCVLTVAGLIALIILNKDNISDMLSNFVTNIKKYIQ